MFNATFNNISVIMWRPVLLVEETGVPGEKPKTQVTDKLYHICCIKYISPGAGFELTTLVTFFLMEMAASIKGILKLVLRYIFSTRDEGCFFSI